MPNRGLKDSIVTSESLDMVSAEAERLFYRLLVTVDDWGWSKANPKLVIAACFPLRSAEMKAEDVVHWLEELRAAEVLEVVEFHGTPYLHFLQWKEHNKPRAVKSKHPVEGARDQATDLNSCEHLLAYARTCKQPHADACQQNTTSISISEYVHETVPERAEDGASGGKKAKREPSTDEQRVVTAYAEGFAQRNGTAPVIEWGQAIKHARLVLAGREPEEAIALARMFGLDPPQWNRDHGMTGFEHLPKAANKLINRLAEMRGSR